MNLSFDLKIAESYKSNSQKARVLTENWVLNNSYCPKCGTIPLKDFENNKPVADFFCRVCSEEYELKSKAGNITNTIADGAFSTMIERLNSNNNPNFFFLTYSKSWEVSNFLIIPKHFFTENIIIKRKPLAPTARRSGWVGCKIDISKIPSSGKVFLVKNSKVIDSEIVNNSFKRTLFIRKKSKEAKGWVLDVLKCIDEIPNDIFKLSDVYKFEPQLRLKHPNNNFIKDKIRQQLQILRDKGFVEFISRGKYKKINNENI